MIKYGRTGPLLKGQIKCFGCRSITRAKDGEWRETPDQQVFMCKSCELAPALKILSPAAAFKL
ncbi:MAG: hypothetical protein ACJ763_03340 [Bdellovibrionia bacterium]